MASLPTSTVAGGARLFAIPDNARGIVTITRPSDGSVIQAFCIAPYTGIAPHITSITPASGKPGDTVTINGVNLGDTLTAIRFGAGYIQVSPSYQDATKIVCIVPTNADSGGVRVDTVNTGVSNVFPFSLGTADIVVMEFDSDAWGYDSSFQRVLGTGTDTLGPAVWASSINGAIATKTVTTTVRTRLKLCSNRSFSYSDTHLLVDGGQAGVGSAYAPQNMDADNVNPYLISDIIPPGTHTLQLVNYHNARALMAVDRTRLVRA
jgi:hypothetical protein